MSLDIILRHIPSFQFESVGKGIFCPPNSRSVDLGDGIELRFGFYQSVRHSEWQTVLVNVDGKFGSKTFFRFFSSTKPFSTFSLVLMKLVVSDFVIVLQCTQFFSFSQSILQAATFGKFSMSSFERWHSGFGQSSTF
jgi:hypothetical protein